MEQFVVKKNKQQNYGGLMLLLVAGMLAMSGCSHTLHITNLDEQQLSPATPLQEPVKIGVSSGNELHYQNGRYVFAIVDALKRNGSVGQVIYPYSRATSSVSVDMLVDIAVNPKYDGKGSNFFVNFPGFLIFAPAIWGYGYEAQIDTQVSITNMKNNVTQHISAPTHYFFRHADFNRTWTEVGWLEIGIIPLVGGFVFTGYDTEITDQFIYKVSPSYGPHVANKIMTSMLPNAATQTGQIQQLPREAAKLP